MNQYGYIGRKERTRELEKDTAIVVAAFGSTGRGIIGLEIFEKALKNELPDKEIFWAFTSQIIRARTGHPGLGETLAKLEALGYRKAVVQPLYVFPGTEYEELLETCNYFPGMRVLVGEPLFHRWPYIKDVLSVLEGDFIKEGLNLLVAHGTPLAASPANIIYLGMERMLAAYSNVVLSTIEGVPDKDTVFENIAENFSDYKKIRIIPVMYLAGIHVEDDLMGTENSWKIKLQEMGFQVDCPTVSFDGKKYFKGLSFYQEINRFFIQRLVRTLELTEYY